MGGSADGIDEVGSTLTAAADDDSSLDDGPIPEESTPSGEGSMFDGMTRREYVGTVLIGSGILAAGVLNLAETPDPFGLVGPSSRLDHVGLAGEGYMAVGSVGDGFWALHADENGDVVDEVTLDRRLDIDIRDVAGTPGGDLVCVGDAGSGPATVRITPDGRISEPRSLDYAGGRFESVVHTDDKLVAVGWYRTESGRYGSVVLEETTGGERRVWTPDAKRLLDVSAYGSVYYVGGFVIGDDSREAWIGHSDQDLGIERQDFDQLRYASSVTHVAVSGAGTDSLALKALYTTETRDQPSRLTHSVWKPSISRSSSADQSIVALLGGDDAFVELSTGGDPGVSFSYFGSYEHSHPDTDQLVYREQETNTGFSDRFEVRDATPAEGGVVVAGGSGVLGSRGRLVKVMPDGTRAWDRQYR